MGGGGKMRRRPSSLLLSLRRFQALSFVEEVKLLSTFILSSLPSFPFLLSLSSFVRFHHVESFIPRIEEGQSSRSCLLETRGRGKEKAIARSRVLSFSFSSVAVALPPFLAQKAYFDSFLAPARL